MPALLRPDDLSGLEGGVDEREARIELRRQISRLEGELASLFGEAFGHTEIPHRIESATAAPRLLDLGELEAIRDRLAERTAEARSALADRSQVESGNRALLQEMLAAPERFKWIRISRSDVGEPGCGAWHSRPRLGPVGMLMGWWRVKISSGCPLSGRLAAVDHEVESRKAGLRTRRAAAGPVGQCAVGRAGHPRRHRRAGDRGRRR